MKISYPYWVQFQGQALGLVWQSEDGPEETDEDTDCVLVESGRIVTARTPAELSTAASRLGLILEKDEGDRLNLDGLEELLELPISDEICAQILEAWNLFTDIARSVNATLDDRDPSVSKCYDKLFFGNNLESVTPAGEHYSPYFDNTECRLISAVLDRGRAILASHL